MQPNKVYRQAVLDRLSSPEQLNTLMRITNPKSWLALAGCVVVLATAVVWSVLGKIPSKVDASGILIHAGGLADVVAVSEGQVVSVEAEPGDEVHTGQVIARIAQPALRQQIAGLEAQIADATARSDTAVDLPEARRQLEILREQLERQDRVVSHQDGRVVEVRASIGDLVAPGSPIVSLERVGERAPLEALLFVDSRSGKTLRPGMSVEIAPSVVRRERDGVLLGRVRTVESFPSTRQGMMRLLRNEQLVDSLAQEAGGTPIAVRAVLIPARSPSGYRWSSGKGPDLVLTSGTRCTASVTTRRQRPISLVFPALDTDG